MRHTVRLCKRACTEQGDFQRKRQQECKPQTHRTPEGSSRAAVMEVPSLQCTLRRLGMMNIASQQHHTSLMGTAL
jgi:hypothetical protein